MNAAVCRATADAGGDSEPAGALLRASERPAAALSDAEDDVCSSDDCDAESMLLLAGEPFAATGDSSGEAARECSELHCLPRRLDQADFWALPPAAAATSAAVDLAGSTATIASAAPASAEPCPVGLQEAAMPSSTTTDLETEIWSFIRNMEAYSALVAQQALREAALPPPPPAMSPGEAPANSDSNRGSSCAGGAAVSLPDLMPDELWLHVFSYLTPAELSIGAAMVCRRWHRICTDAALWTSLELAFSSSIAPHQLCYVASRAPLLHELSLQGRAPLLPAELHIVGRLCPALRELDVGFCNVGAAEMRAMAECGGYRRLRSLNVEGSGSVSMDFVQLLCRLPELGALNLSHCQVITDAEMVYLARHLSALTELNIDGVSFITDEAIKELVLCHGTRLTSLDLDGAELTDESVQLVAAACRSLTRLRVSFCEQLTDVSLQSIQSLVDLRSLSLRKGQQFSTAALAKMFGSQFQLNQLSSLDLSECTGVDDGVLKNLCDSCHQRLFELRLCWCWEVSEVGLEAVVTKCSGLRILDLLGIDKITGSCLQALPASLPHLMLLDLRQCNRIQDDIVLGVVRRNPGIKVYDYYGELFSAR